MPATAARSHDNYGRPTYTTRAPEPHTVFGGWRMAYTDWVRDEDGWDCDYDFDGLPTTVFATEAECLAAIEQRAAVEKASLYLNTGIAA